LQKLQSLAELQSGYFFVNIYIEIKIYLIIIKLQASVNPLEYAEFWWLRTDHREMGNWQGRVIMAHLTLGMGERHNNADSQPKDLLVDFLSQPDEFDFQGFPLSMC
jgi:hypothetical protein